MGACLGPDAPSPRVSTTAGLQTSAGHILTRRRSNIEQLFMYENGLSSVFEFEHADGEPIRPAGRPSGLAGAQMRE